MAAFAYKAYFSTGSLVSGELEADTEIGAFAALRDRGLVSVEIAEGSSPETAARETARVRDPKLLVRFTRMMASLTAMRSRSPATARSAHRRAPHWQRCMTPS